MKNHINLTYKFVVFVILQPGLILLFLILWRIQKDKNNKFKNIYNQNNERFR